MNFSDHFYAVETDIDRPVFDVAPEQRIRIYDEQENVYEAYTLTDLEDTPSIASNAMTVPDRMDVRLYTQQEGWTAKVRKRFSDSDEVYELYADTCELLESFYDLDMRLYQKGLFEDYREHDKKITTRQRGKRVRVNWEHDVEFPEKELFNLPPIFLGLAPMWADSLGTAAAAVAPGLGAVGYAGGILLPAICWGGPKIAEHRLNNKKKEHLQDTDSLEDEDLFNLLNNWNQKQQHAKEVGVEIPHPPEDVIDGIDTLMDVQFESFHELKGVMTMYHGSTYAQAVEFTGAATGTVPDETGYEEPSMYDTPSVFKQLLDATTRDSSTTDRTFTTEPTRKLIQNAIDTETHPEIGAYVQNEYGDLLDEIGMKYVTRGDAEQ